MMNLKRLAMIVLALSSMLAACAPATAPVVRATTPALPTVPPATALPTHEPAGIGVPVFEYADNSSELLIISSVTGKPFDEFAPIPVAPSYSYAVSPDGKTLALLSAAQLCLIDLPSWKYRTLDVGLHGRPGIMVYSPDGAWLVLAGAEPDSNLQVVDAKRGEVKASTQAGFSVTNARFTGDDTAIMVYGPQLATSGIAGNVGVSTGAPRVSLYSASDLSVRWSVELNGVRAGTFPKKAGTEDTQSIYEPGSAWHFDPGIAFAPDRDALYVVHGNEEKLTTVDFSTRKVKTIGIRKELGWLEQIMALTAGVAYAKGMDGTSKQAIISADGKYLYVVGSTEAVTPLAKGSNWDFKFTPLGLSVIATEDGTLVDKVDTEATLAMLSADGMQVLLLGWNNDNSSTPWTDVYDPSSRSIVKHMAGLSLTPTRRMDGHVILASTNTYSDNFCHSASIDPKTWGITGDWKGICPEWLSIP